MRPAEGLRAGQTILAAGRRAARKDRGAIGSNTPARTDEIEEVLAGALHICPAVLTKIDIQAPPGVEPIEERVE
jgi:hypothetical protein